ncbi:Ig-like domain-containing protein, partial [uncultured Nevskia sp.]|uniref:Ig-like domain-containing protein n=1 Tax=uncultured Nevskia sp. TaxID=228950 RepID=UPI0025E8C260
MRDRKNHFRTIGNWLALVLLASLVSACGENQTGDVTPPTVIATSPINTQTGVPVSTTAVTATFSESINPATINGASFLLTAGEGGAVAGTVSYSGVVASYTLAAPLAPNTTYTATITTAVLDLADNALASNFTWQFTTGALPDTTPPQVNAVDPANDSADVPSNRRIVATFSEAIDPASLDANSFTLTGLGGAPVAGTASVSGSVLTFTPGNGTTTAQLQNNTIYTATLAAGITDLSGNPLGTAFTWTFTTGVIDDTTSPTVVLTDPFAGEVGTPVNAQITVTFSEVINAATLTASSFTVTDPSNAVVAGTIAYSGNSATFTPSAPLAASTLFTVTVSNAVTDLAGNALVGSVIQNPYQFTTGLAPDVTPPFVNLTSPPAAATNVCINSTINARFNETIDANTINAASFIVTAPGGAQVPGAVTYNATTRVATFRQSENFIADTVYTVTVTNAVTDRAGNALVVGTVPNPWTFRVGPTNTVCQLPVPLRSLVSFALVGGTGGLNNTAGPTTVTGDIALAPSTTCLMCAAPDLVLNGTIYSNEAVANQAKADLRLAFDDAHGRPTGATTPLLGGLTLTPGVYSSATTMSIADGTTLTLDALGDSSAVWVFQVGTDLTFGAGSQIVLANGATATNVFWVVDGAITSGSG